MRSFAEFLEKKSKMFRQKLAKGVKGYFRCYNRPLYTGAVRSVTRKISLDIDGINSESFMNL